VADAEPINLACLALLVNCMRRIELGEVTPISTIVTPVIGVTVGSWGHGVTKDVWCGHRVRKVFHDCCNGHRAESKKLNFYTVVTRSLMILRYGHGSQPSQKLWPQ